MKIKLTFYGAAQMVTGSCFLLETGTKKILVDCGLFQGNKELRELNYGPFPFTPAEIDFVLLTHAHIDHSGLIPKLYKEGFRGPTYATHGTADLAAVMLPDSGHIQEMEVERKNRKLLRLGKDLLTPIYTSQDAIDCIKYFKQTHYDEEISPAEGIRVKFRDAGHILGSAMLEVWVRDGEKETKIVFSGDLGRTDRPIVKDTAIIEEADYLVMESTYGNREHEDLNDNERTLRETVNQTFRRGGNVIIPAFAVDRTQDLLLTLNKMIGDSEINPHSVYVDSPLAIAATEIFCKYPAYYDQETRNFMNETGLCPFLLPVINFSRTADESIALNKIKKGAIIISASGMADAGRIRHHLKHNLWRPECSVVFVGYQAPGTLGRMIVDGAKTVKIHGEDVAVKAKIVMLEGYSAHADQSELLAWLDGFKKMPRSVFITHGEDDSRQDFAELVTGRYGTRGIVPARGESFELVHQDVVPLVTAPAAGAERENVMDLYRRINASLDQMVREDDAEKLQQIREYLERLSA